MQNSNRCIINYGHPGHMADMHGEPGSGDAEEGRREGMGVPQFLQAPVLLSSMVLPELGQLLPADLCCGGGVPEERWGEWASLN